MRRVVCGGLITVLFVSGCATFQPPPTAQPPVTPAEQKEVCEHFAERAKALVQGHSVWAGAAAGFGVGAGMGVMVLARGNWQAGSSADFGILGLVIAGAGAVGGLVGSLVGAGTSASKNESLRASAYADAMDVCLKPVVLTQTLGPQHPEVARSLRALAYRYYRQAEFAQAEALYQQALAIQETALGPEAPEVATTLDDYAALLRQTNRPAEAATLEQRAQAIRAGRARLAPTSTTGTLLPKPQVGITPAPSAEAQQRAREEEMHRDPGDAQKARMLANLYVSQGQYAQAEPLYQQALALEERTLGTEHPVVAVTLTDYAVLLRKTGRDAEAAAMEARADSIRAQAEGPPPSVPQEPDAEPFVYMGVLSGGHAGAGFSTEITLEVTVDDKRLRGRWTTTDGRTGTVEGEVDVARSPTLRHFVVQGWQVTPCLGAFRGDGWLNGRTLSVLYRGHDCRGALNAQFQVTQW